MRDYNDYELISLAKEMNEEARDILFKKYEHLMIQLAKKKENVGKKLGVDLADLIQEAMVGFSEAIRDFREEEGVLFYTFASICMERQIFSFLKRAGTSKNKTLNEAVSLDAIDDEMEKPLANVYGDFEADPELKLFSSIEEEEFIVKLKEELTEFEEQVFELKLKGFSYLEIAEILDKDTKSIDNAIQRIRNKIKPLINK